MESCVETSKFVDVGLVLPPNFYVVFFFCRCDHHLGNVFILLFIMQTAKQMVDTDDWDFVDLFLKNGGLMSKGKQNLSYHCGWSFSGGKSRERC